MNNKGQEGWGMLVIVAITLIVGVILVQVVAQQIGSATDTNLIINRTLATTGLNGSAVYINDYRHLEDVVMTNATGATSAKIITSGNYTVTNNVINPTTGGLSVRINISVDPETVDDVDWNMSATGQPLTYIDNSGGRALAGMIVIFFALGVLVVALYPTLRQKFA